GTKRAEARPQLIECEAINTRIHFPDGALLVRGVFLFDNGLYAPFWVPKNAPVIGGIVQFGAENGCRCFAPAVRVEQGRERFGPQERRVARYHDGDFRAGAYRAPRNLQRVSRASLRLL